MTGFSTGIQGGARNDTTGLNELKNVNVHEARRILEGIRANLDGKTGIVRMLHTTKDAKEIKFQSSGAFKSFFLTRNSDSQAKLLRTHDTIVQLMRNAQLDEATITAFENARPRQGQGVSAAALSQVLRSPFPALELPPAVQGADLNEAWKAFGFKYDADSEILGKGTYGSVQVGTFRGQNNFVVKTLAESKENHLPKLSLEDRSIKNNVVSDDTKVEQNPEPRSIIFLANQDRERASSNFATHEVNILRLDDRRHLDDSSEDDDSRTDKSLGKNFMLGILNLIDKQDNNARTVRNQDRSSDGSLDASFADYNARLSPNRDSAMIGDDNDSIEENRLLQDAIAEPLDQQDRMQPEIMSERQQQVDARDPSFALRGDNSRVIGGPESARDDNLDAPMVASNQPRPKLARTLEMAANWMNDIPNIVRPTAFAVRETSADGETTYHAVSAGKSFRTWAEKTLTERPTHTFEITQILMPKAQGEPLLQFDNIDEEDPVGIWHPLTEAELKSLSQSLIGAIQGMSEHLFIHGDIKPENIMSGGAIIDLGGLQKLHKHDPRAKLGAGTLPYLLPPFWINRIMIDATYNVGYERDLYAAGLVLLEMSLPPDRRDEAIAGLNDFRIGTDDRRLHQKYGDKFVSENGQEPGFITAMKAVINNLGLPRSPVREFAFDCMATALESYARVDHNDGRAMKYDPADQNHPLSRLARAAQSL